MTIAQIPGALRPFAAAPGPRGLPVLGNAHQIKPEIFHQQLEAWERQYGQTFSFPIGSRRFLAVSDPLVVGAVLRQQQWLLWVGKPGWCATLLGGRTTSTGALVLKSGVALSLPGQVRVNDRALRCVPRAPALFHVLFNHGATPIFL